MRLRDKGRLLGLVSEDEYTLFVEKKKAVERELARLRRTGVKPSAEVNSALKEKGSTVLDADMSLEQLLKRPELTYRDIISISPAETPLRDDAGEQVEIQVKYEGYIQRQVNQVARFAGLEQKIIPEDLDYDSVKGLGTEVRQKLKQVQPISLGQAARISGVTPAAISILMVALEKRKRGEIIR
jgi:tRNA uridine 5-carboxymethylaminomethyl modification enzyme